MVIFLPHSRISFLFESQFLIYMLSRILEERNCSLIPLTTKKKKTQVYAYLYSVIYYKTHNTPLNFIKTRRLGWWDLCEQSSAHAVALEKD